MEILNTVRCRLPSISMRALWKFYGLPLVSISKTILYIGCSRGALGNDKMRTPAQFVHFRKKMIFQIIDLEPPWGVGFSESLDPSL